MATIISQLDQLCRIRSNPLSFRHKKLTSSEAATVRLEFEDEGNLRWIQRSLDGTGQTNTSESHPGVAEVCQDSKNALCFLTRSRFSSMIDIAERERWTKLTPLLGHDRLASLREGTRALANSIKRDLEETSLSSQVKDANQQAKAILVELSERQKQAALKVISPEVITTELRNIGLRLDDVTSYTDFPWPTLLSQVPGSERLAGLTKQLEDVNRERAACAPPALDEEALGDALIFSVELESDPKLRHVLIHATLYQIALNTVAANVDEACPLCGLTPVSWDNVRATLRIGVSNSKSTKDRSDRAKQALSLAHDQLSNSVTRIDEFLKDKTPRKGWTELRDGLIRLRDFISLAINKLTQQLPGGLTQPERTLAGTAALEVQRDCLALAQTISVDETALRTEMERMASSPEWKRYMLLKEVADAAGKLDISRLNAVRLEKKLAITKQIIGDVQRLFPEVDEAENHLNATLMAELESEVARIFSRITDQTQLVPRIINSAPRGIRQTEIEIQDFHGLGAVPARDYLSEANRNALGISIYFAGILRRAPTLGAIVMDDITHSADSIHRLALAGFLVEELSSKLQMLLFTHDDNWFEWLSRRLEGQSKRIKILKWHPDGLSFSDDKWSTLLATASNQIEKFDKSGGNSLRQALEEFMSDLCEQFKIEVPYVKNANDVKFEVKRQRLINALKRASDSGRAIVDPSLPPILVLQQSQRITNMASHNGSFESWNMQDLIDTLQDVRDLMSPFYCKQLKSGKTCNGLLPSLEKKSGKMPSCDRCKEEFKA